ncbi:hypothetical protein [Saccharothrix sp.]|uniref:hypothetical protein n=1 Tax=Saccharothrix sp. TaxID=1873460 RepID=UPI002811F2E7|nr:hypothetical protein [Saccharothrix sp.]
MNTTDRTTAGETTDAVLKIRALDATVTMRRTTAALADLGRVTAFDFHQGAPRVTLTLSTGATVVIGQEDDDWKATRVTVEGENALDHDALAELAGSYDPDRVRAVIDELWLAAWSMVTQLAEQTVKRLRLALAQLLDEHV